MEPIPRVNVERLAGDVVQVLDELRALQAKREAPDKNTPDSYLRKVLATTINYLENNRNCMK